ncbi:MAG: acetate--CoA ligase family protein [Candidatus Altiarchaeales archaeon]|nr:acetate--CoA ligase family protein [Candidatus Altiarchaeales archaeon]
MSINPKSRMKIPDHHAYKILEGYGINTAPYRFAGSLTEAEEFSEEMTYPLFLKIDSPEVIHKSDSGCVLLVNADYDLEDRFNELMKNAHKITENINGVIIQERVEGKEFIVGSKKDEQFGRVIAFGLGGIFVEAIRDISFRLIPIERFDAESMIRETQAFNVLKARGESDITEVVDVLMRISGLAEKEDIEELDINPLIVNNMGACVADVRIIK